MIEIRLAKNYNFQGGRLSRQSPGHSNVWNKVRFTEDEITECDYLVVLNYIPNDVVVTCPVNNLWVLVQEPYYPDFFGWMDRYHDQFAKIFAPNDAKDSSKIVSTQTCLPWLCYDADIDFDYLLDLCIPPKRLNISAVVSSQSLFPGHLKRLEFVRYLQNHKPFEIDLFGRGINPIEKKWDALAPYKYSIAIENTKSSHYWTEKLADCFLAYTLPIYCGAEKLEEYFPPESFVRIDIEDIQGSIEIIRQVLSDDIWEERLPAIKKARDLVLNKYQLFPFIADKIAQDNGNEKEKKAVFIRGYNKEKGFVIKPQLLFSVVVCTYNRGDLLADCLSSLVCQTFNPAQYEVIIVDNNSTDDTQKIAEGFVAENSCFRLIAESEQGLSRARNKGLTEALGEYVAFVDDDARVPENWLETAARIVAANAPDIFGGPATPIFGCETPAWYKESYGVRGDMGATGWLKEGFIVGTNIFFRKDLLEEYGGFDPELGMKGDSVGYHEETALVYRAFAEGRKVYFSKELAVKDRMPDYKLSLAYFIYSKYKVGYDGVKLWGNEYPVDSLPEVLTMIDNTMNSFDFALRKREAGKYLYPENYIVEELAPLLVEIGKRVKYFKHKDGCYDGLNISKESINESVFKLAEKNGCWQMTKALAVYMIKRVINKLCNNSNANAA